jgi:8-oxo-dGTP diphosphatase
VNEILSPHGSGFIPVVAAVMEKDGSYLICRRPLEKRHGGLWEFPGGKLLPGESAFDGTSRELKEELALKVTALGDALLSIQDPDSEFVIMFYPVEASGEPILLEHLELRWVEPDALLDFDLAPTDRRFAETIATK